MDHDTQMDNQTAGMGTGNTLILTMLCWTISQVTQFISVFGPVIKTFVDFLMAISILLLIIKNIPGAMKVIKSGFKTKED